ncbi:hypothetical protein, conserved [Leishmania tarentolae]|uniref:Uncharacterized protein n=1 Tax=Leishmania tarentolae TaxID=5689 RepID=A0A640KGC7_LEITA|nr:hypothetical protein, conserved [Leishmania tarentolae]
MLREARKRKQQVCGKIGHEEYIYRLNGNAFNHQGLNRIPPQGGLDPHQLPAAGIRVGAGGARGAGGPSRPPFAVDDDANYSDGCGRGSPGAPLNPIPGPPNGMPYKEAAALYSAPEGCNGGTPPGKNYAAANYISPYGGGGVAGAHLYPGVSPAQHIVSAFAPVIPALAPAKELPAPLPAVYRPKPPLTFHTGPAAGTGVPHISFTPLPQHPAPSQMFYPSSEAGTPGPAAAPAHLSPSDKGAGRPNTSPTVLPPLNLDDDHSNGGVSFPTRNSRPSTGRVALGGGGGGVFMSGDGLSAAEDRQREKMAARQRAIELQNENARQILEKQLRKQAEREREIQEERLAEERLRLEREEVARREQAELDREKREKELKMMGSRAAQAMLEQQQRETQQRREEEAAVRRHRGRTPVAPEAPETGKEALKSTTPPPATFASVASTSPPSKSPENYMLPPAVSSALLPPASAPALPRLADFSLSSGLRQSPQPLPGPYYHPPANVWSQAAPLPNTDAQFIHRELRRITNLLEEQQLRQQRAMDGIKNGTSLAPQPWCTGALQPSSTAGAGTYLTTGQPSPCIGAGGAAPVIAAQRNSGTPYKSFVMGGTLPPPPFATAAQLASSSSDAGAPSSGIGPSPRPLPPYSGSSAAGNPLNPLSSPILQYTSSITDTEPELSTEPSRFIGPFRAPVTEGPGCSVASESGTTFSGVEPMPTKPLAALVDHAAVTKLDREHGVVTPPPASTAASSRLSPVSSASVPAPAPFSMPEMNSTTGSSNMKKLPSVCNNSPQETEGSGTDVDEGGSEGRVSAPPMP